MSSQLVPINQINALPLLTTQDVTQGGTLTVVGGSVSRVFTPTQLNVNNVAPILHAGYYVVNTPYLDLRGCSQFWFLLQVANPAGSGGNLTLTGAPHVFMQARFGPTDTPAVPDLGNSVFAGCFRDPTSAAGMGAGQVLVPGTTQRYLFGWSSSGQVDSTGNGNNLAVLGQNMRLIISAGSAAFTDTRCVLMGQLEGSS